MKTKLFLLIFLFAFKSFLWSNPIDDTPVFKFSEMVFDSHNNWTMELLSPFDWNYKNVDSVLIKVSNTIAKLNIQIRKNTKYYVVTCDSLSVPLTINPDGDKILIYTYSSIGNKIRSDSTVFGTYPGALAGKPLPGYSLCKSTLEAQENFTDIVYISKKPSLGVINDLTGLGGKMTGHIYDMDNKLITKYKVLQLSPAYFELHTPITINPDGTYSTTIYPMIIDPDSITINQLSVRMYDFEGWHHVQDIGPIVLPYIKPDTAIVRDIHVKSNDYVLTAVKRNDLQKNNELTLINYPNPFNSSTNFFLKLPDDIKGKHGEINIFNATGQLVRSISAKDGTTSFWDGKDMNRNVMASGIYYYKLNIDKQIMKSGSMILLK